MASIFLGTAAAVGDGSLSLPWLGVTVLGIFAIEVAKNASGEVFDFDSGTDRAVAEDDRSPFSGGKRVLVDGLLTRAQTWAVAAVAYGIGMVSGLAIVVFRDPRVLGVGLVGMACAYFYHAPPLRLSYRGLGEVTVGVCYGPLICGGTYLVQRGTVATDVIWLAIPLGVLIAAFLWINEFPDYRADTAAGKRNLVVRLGRRGASLGFAALMILAFALLLLLPRLGVARGVWFGAVALVPAMRAVAIVISRPTDTAALTPAQALTLLTFLTYALSAGLGVMLVPG